MDDPEWPPKAQHTHVGDLRKNPGGSNARNDGRHATTSHNPRGLGNHLKGNALDDVDMEEPPLRRGRGSGTGSAQSHVRRPGVERLPSCSMTASIGGMGSGGCLHPIAQSSSPAVLGRNTTRHAVELDP